MGQRENERAQILKDMKESEAWEILDAYLKDVEKNSMTSLLNCDLDKIPHFRGKVATVRGLYNFIDYEIEKGEE